MTEIVETAGETPDVSRHLRNSVRALGIATLASAVVAAGEPIATPDAFAEGKTNTPHSHAEFKAAPDLPYFKYTPPQGKFRGVAMIIHGGGWVATGQEVATAPYILQRAHEVRKAGFASLNITYRPGQEGHIDIENFYDMARRKAKGRAVCAWGSSAGAYWVLRLVTSKDRKPDCAVTEGAPVNLNTLNDKVKPLALNAFAPGLNGAAATQALKRWSPSEHTNMISTQCLVGNARYDPLIGPEQAELLDSVPGVEVELLDRGPGIFTHATGDKGLDGVDTEDLKKFRMDERKLLISTAKRIEAKQKIKSSR